MIDHILTFFYFLNRPDHQSHSVTWRDVVHEFLQCKGTTSSDTTRTNQCLHLQSCVGEEAFKHPDRIVEGVVCLLEASTLLMSVLNVALVECYSSGKFTDAAQSLHVATVRWT